MCAQAVLRGAQGLRDFSTLLIKRGLRRALLVCGPSFDALPVAVPLLSALEAAGCDAIRFGSFHPNPDFASAAEGVALLQSAGCDCILAVGGGSALDIAKCIKRYALSDPAGLRPDLVAKPNGIPLFALPTTAGSGSEVTRFSVIYDRGEKQSIADAALIPEAALLLPEALATLPPYQRRATMLDTLCHAIESYWSVRATPQSRQCARDALALARRHHDGYLQNTLEGNAGMLDASNLAGQAIDQTQTTAAHAMCYKLTTRHGLAHGHAVALCLPPLWRYLLAHTCDRIDPHGPDGLAQTLQSLALAFGCDSAQEAPDRFEALVRALDLPPLSPLDDAELDLLAMSVNTERLQNTPVALDTAAIRELYRGIAR